MKNFQDLSLVKIETLREGKIQVSERESTCEFNFFVFMG